MLITNGDRLKHHFQTTIAVKLFTVPEILTIIDTFSEEIPEGVWITIKQRPGTDEEYEAFSKFGDCPREDFMIYVNKMPENGEEVLVTTRMGDVRIDTYHNDIDCCYFEDNDDPDEVVAWMPKPIGYGRKVTL